MENEQVKQETIKLEETRKQPSKLEGPGGPARRSYWGCYNCRGVRFLVWNWSRFRCYDG